MLFSAKGVLFLFLIGYVHHSTATNSVAAAWRWECVEGQCVKKELHDADLESALSLSECSLFCSPDTAIWPKPTGELSIGNTLEHLNINSIDVLTNKSDSPVGQLFALAAKRFKDNIELEAPKYSTKPGGKSLEVLIDVENQEQTELTLETDESYTLKVSETSDGRIRAAIKARTFFGGRHGLETLGQLIILDDIRNEILITRDVSISDRPVYPYRGMLLDTGRNYITVDTIKRTIEGMATSKLNTFHWHMTDSQSFPFVSNLYPNLTKYGAYTPQKVYTHNAIRDVIAYAKVRGVRVLPEFDAPAHVGEGWQGTGLVTCLNAKPWMSYCVEPPCGQFDPTKPELYDVLEGIYGEMVELFKPDIFHMGGDEVNTNCWDSTKNIVDWMGKKGWGRTEADFMKLWNHFQTQAYARLLKKTGKALPVIMWTSHLTKAEYVEKYLPKDDYIIQIWTTGTDYTIQDLLNKDYRLILSNYDALYFDCGFEGWVQDGNNWCAPYIGWQKVYDNSPLKMFGANKQKNILGAEAALWTEQVDDTTVDSRFWPRAAAMAERLWGEPDQTWHSAETRMLIHRARLVRRGIKASRMQPEWCLQNQGDCPIGH